MSDITVLWAGPELVPYEKEEHAQLVFKFLYWGEGANGHPIIIAGNNNYSHANINFIAEGSDVVAHDKKPDGAGTCLWEFGISWTSTSLKVTTPDALRPIILEAIGLS